MDKPHQNPVPKNYEEAFKQAQRLCAEQVEQKRLLLSLKEEVDKQWRVTSAEDEKLFQIKMRISKLQATIIDNKKWHIKKSKLGTAIEKEKALQETWRQTEKKQNDIFATIMKQRWKEDNKALNIEKVDINKIFAEANSHKCCLMAKKTKLLSKSKMIEEEKEKIAPEKFDMDISNIIDSKILKNLEEANYEEMINKKTLQIQGINSLQKRNLLQNDFKIY